MKLRHNTLFKIIKKLKKSNNKPIIKDKKYFQIFYKQMKNIFGKSINFKKV